MDSINQPPRPPQKATIADVAKAAGVSKTTISRYLSGDYKSISEATLIRIKQSVKELRYRPSRLARGLRQDRSYSIGMIFADISNPFSTSVLKGAEDVCTKQGYSMIVCNTDNDPEKEKNYIAMMHDQRVDGLIIHPTGQNLENLRELSEDQIPIVMIDRRIPGLKVDTVGTDNEKAMTEATGYFLDQGFERIGFFSQPIQHVSSRIERAQTFVQILATAGHPSVDDIYEYEPRIQGQFDEQLDRFIAETQGQYRMIFAVNVVTQLKLINALQKRGLRIPEDVGFAGVDDSEWAPVVGSGLTTIAQPTYEIGYKAMEQILERIAGDNGPEQHFALSANLITRGSTPSRNAKIL
ncbi:LacI family DNA-binding transcriptional regulator [Paenibacillus rhizophilus]|uniref:LacI family DNA-binding transcriptional regulator n=1 Tax=Paenibacillus rhizophilus TaxID=1850366 RepID=A0A3N9PV31_9BACL|nr:LacI family DNA-binding transcriptional regulator [Paenibacillus rhizophilus]RQW10272.1 LacI family DNA-binding transcriptional regulator [Paenibacillus rhizophilus]